MYKSPVEVITEEMKFFYDGDVVRAVQKHDINIDKEELLKALRYDRDQYEKGYADGKRDAIDKLVRCEDCKYSYVCGDGTTLRCDVLFPSLSLVDNDDFCSQGERRNEDD
jgi:hypothetical protein